MEVTGHGRGMGDGAGALLLSLTLAATAACGSSGTTTPAGGEGIAGTVTATGGNAPKAGSASSTGGANAFTVPTYDPKETLPTTYQADLSATTKRVTQYQDKGQLLGQLVAQNGKVKLDNGEVVLLTSIPAATCPPTLAGCTTTDSAALGIGSSSVLADLASIKGGVRNQGARGTCAAFASCGAVELLTLRKGAAADLSEQNAYFQGKRVEAGWGESGLHPATFLQAFAVQGVPFVPESAWPYNSADKDCASYLAAHPTSTCSATEAQGGGADGQQPDPTATAATGTRLAEVHELYASVGRIKQALYRGYPVVIGVNANSDFNIASRKGGVVSWVFKVSDCGGSVCGHAVLAVGYADSPDVEGGGYLIVKNSWDSTWGDGGLCYPTYAWLQNSLLDAQAVVSVR